MFDLDYIQKKIKSKPRSRNVNTIKHGNLSSDQYTHRCTHRLKTILD